ncbi:MAG TPA: hypothetical protein VK151_05675 [Fluviicola sp.]|nr:hypothetical protein [Fluviicola sp.]
MELDLFPDDARIWVFTSDREVSSAEQQALAGPILSFLEQWATHGKPLTATGAWLNSYQLAIVLDQSKVGASGCSIDALTRFMREIGSSNQIDWFNRMNMLIEKDGTVQRIPFADLKNYPNALLFDPLVETLGDIRGNWPVPVGESRFKSVI